MIFLFLITEWTTIDSMDNNWRYYVSTNSWKIRALNLDTCDGRHCIFGFNVNSGQLITAHGLINPGKMYISVVRQYETDCWSWCNYEYQFLALSVPSGSILRRTGCKYNTL